MGKSGWRAGYRPTVTHDCDITPSAARRNRQHDGKSLSGRSVCRARNSPPPRAGCQPAPNLLG